MENEVLAHVRPYNSEKEECGCDALLLSANEFLDAFQWAKRTGRVWVSECIPGVVGLFLFELDPPGPNVDKYIWVVVGDLPPAYLSPVYARSPRAALDGYIGEMELWVDAVENGRSTDDLTQ
jgi:hypothetical protein